MQRAEAQGKAGTSSKVGMRQEPCAVDAAVEVFVSMLATPLPHLLPKLAQLGVKTKQELCADAHMMDKEEWLAKNLDATPLERKVLVDGLKQLVV